MAPRPVGRLASQLNDAELLSPAMFNLRFDLRVPPFADTTHPQLYSEMRSMARWADTRGFAGLILSEHHGTEDGFMNAPLAAAAALLGTTDNLTCSIAALLLPYHDPIRVAEDIATIDLLAPGRLITIIGIGYRESEFEMFDKDRTRRGRDTEAALELMKRCWTGEPFEHEGRTIWVTPKPATQPHPIVMVGGSVPASAKRAARLHLPFMPPLPDPALAEIYYAEAEELGFAEPFCMLSEGPGMVMVSEDPDATWAAIGRNAVYDAGAYANWQYPDQRSSWAVEAEDVEGLKASGQWAVVTPEECADLVRTNGGATLHPLVGGIDPAIGWESLELVHSKVMPALAE